MSDLYELAFTLQLKRDLSQETRGILRYMTRSVGVSNKPPTLDHPFFHVEGFKTEWTYLIANPRNDDEEMLEGECGSALTDEQLTFRGLIHEDPFWNTWEHFSNWLLSISSSTGLIGYYRNIQYDDHITLIVFEAERVCDLPCQDYSEFEDLQIEIIDTLRISEVDPPMIQRVDG